MCCELKRPCHVQWKGKPRRAWWSSDKHKVTRRGNVDECKITKARCVMPVNMNAMSYDWMIRLSKNDSERQKEEIWWLKMSEWVCTTALKVKNKERCWHWMLSWRNVMALNAKLEANNGSKRRNEDAALNTELKEIWWIWMPNWRKTCWLWMSNWRHGS